MIDKIVSTDNKFSAQDEENTKGTIRLINGNNILVYRLITSI